MTGNESCRRDFLCALLFTISLILGAIVATLFFFGILPFIVAAIPFILVVAIIILLIAIIILLVCGFLGQLPCRGDCDCISPACKAILKFSCCLIAGAIATIILAIIALSAVLTAFSIAGAILVFLLAVAFIFTLLAFIAFIKKLNRLTTGRRYHD
jgi:hypothetical protein